MFANSTDLRNFILSSHETVALPVLTHLGIEMAGHTVEEAVKNAEIHALAVKTLSDHYTAIASTMIMDLTVEAEAFGAKVEFTSDDVPNVSERLVCDAASVEALQVPGLDAGRVPVYLHANELIAANATKPVFSGCIGPFSLAARLYDMSELMMALFIDPDTAHMLLEKCTQFIIAYCQGLRKAGSNGVVMAEPAAGLLSAEQCDEFSSAYVRDIINKVQDDNFGVILHNCGSKGHCTASMISTGAMGLHFGNETDMVEVLENCPEDILVMGNLDPVSVLKQGTPDSVYASTMELLQKCGKYRNFVLSSGCDVPPHTPQQNIDAFYRALNDYNQEK